MVCGVEIAVDVEAFAHMKSTAPPDAFRSRTALLEPELLVQSTFDP
jgi:hypothetical protein